MNDVVYNKIKQYVEKNKNKAFSLKNWITLNSKGFKLIDALYAVYMEAGGDFATMTEIIDQLTEKKRVQGRSQVHAADDVSVIDIKDVNGKLKVVGFQPGKELQKKGQHRPQNNRIFTKSDTVNKNFVRSEEKMYDLGKLVRNLYPEGTNSYITYAMQAIRKYAAARKINPELVVKKLDRGTLKLIDDDYNSFEVVPVRESKTVIINDTMARMLSESLEMTEYKFINNVKAFLKQLLDDPANAQPSVLLKTYGITRSKLLRMLLSLGLIQKEMKISDTDENGEPRERAMMKVKFRVPKPMQRLDRGILKMYRRIFEKNVPVKNESLTESTGHIETYYRGFNSELGEQKDHLLWLTDDPEYAAEYGDTVMEYQIDEDKLRGIGYYGIVDLLDGEEIDGFDDTWHPFDGLSEEIVELCLRNGYNCYDFHANGGDSYCICLFDKSPIVSRKVIKWIGESIDVNSFIGGGENELNEEGDVGATSAIQSGEVVQPLFGEPIRRKMPTDSDVDEATTTSNAGNYEYDVPFAADEETRKRGDGVGGSTSVQIAK